MSIDQAVRDQYEALPYPSRDPKDEAKRLVIGSPSHLGEVTQHVFGGKLPGRPLRFLFAGGGTGDGLVMLSQQLKDAGRSGDTIVYLDQSAASRKIAEARVAARGLTVQFVTGSLLDIATLGLGTFDYIDSCGVLHHLDSPEAGLAALTSALSPDGGLGLMVYGAYGRRGVYDLQEILRSVAADGNPQKRVALTRKILAGLPPTNWLRLNRQINGHVSGDAAEVFDLLLHARDRPYSVAEIVTWLSGAGLRLASWAEPARYDPANFVTDGEARTRFAELPQETQWAMAEMLAGGPAQHVFYATRQGNAVAPPAADDLDAIPVLTKMSGAQIVKIAGPRMVLEANDGALLLKRALPVQAPLILPLIDGQRSWRAIFAALDRKGFDEAQQQKAAEALVRALGGINLLLLRRA
jgi:SAM-dependent methyltransferase